MSILVALSHETRYQYDQLVGHSPHVIRLRPAPHCRTEIESYSLKLSSTDHFINWQLDPFGNYMARCVFPNPLPHLHVTVDLIAKMAVRNPFDFFLEKHAETFPFDYEAEELGHLGPYLRRHPVGPRLKAYLESISLEPVHTVDFLVALNQRLAQDIRYLIRLEPGVQTPEETLGLQSGSCRDSAWLLIHVLRELGLASRFVSGYLIQLRADEKSLDGPSGPEEDFGDLHAWCEVYLPGAGWIGLDPTSGLLAGEGHIPMACTPSPAAAAPITGATGKCEVEFSHKLTVTRVKETPRVTFPYSDEEWKAIQEEGSLLDEQLKSMDVRLTMGGEPTFVSIDDMGGAEWNFTADSPAKRGLAQHLLERLKRRLAPGALLHFGQGKWYPGEPLPRWALGCHWRTDGASIWKDESLIAPWDRNLGHGSQQALDLGQAIMRHLGLSTETITPAHEDIYYYLWREQRLPNNVDVFNSKLEDPIERKRLARIFEQGLDQVVGYALPIMRNTFRQKWETGLWALRRGHMFLIPGDSPMGYRLPLDSLPFVPTGHQNHIYPPDPLAEFPLLPSWEELRRRRAAHSQMRIPGEGKSPGDREKGKGPSPQAFWPPHPEDDQDPTSAPDHRLVRTALCIEPRHGRLHVFMPPIQDAADYLELIAAIEKAAADLTLPVCIEGEPPPYSPWLKTLKITPDPGVIEVNVPPVEDWKHLEEQTRIIYEEARASRLGTEKFMLDGRHTGTGGGNHITLGGTTPSDSPFLRRPDLLRSLVTYWHNHPSLSFLFSGMFIGPTSQHPRVDEARNDALYELEIANARVDGIHPETIWMVDRLFRNLLVDITGNTHRAEFCIDKMFSPDSSSGRLGLLEMRAFEMPPHYRMNLVQQLLVRGLIAKFWKEPCVQPLTRWGTRIHDQFMLPHFNQADLRDVLADLRHSGVDIKDEWFQPHFEFRFPKHGEVSRQGVHIELRHALEPWHVLGEQVSGSGTARYVDSSLERIEVKVHNLTETRHILTCNGRRVPLHPTGTRGEHVAGIRFRAWQPPECLHPNIGVHAPLVLDLLDTWNHRSLGGCTYHVSDPGGRNHEHFPVNALEAEGRRLARFFAHGHTPGPFNPPPREINQDFPMTLDLRTRPRENVTRIV